VSGDFEATVLAALGALQDGQADVRAQLSDVRAAVMDRIDRLQNDLTGTRDDLTVNMAGIDRVWRAIAADRDALEGVREAVTVLQRHVKRLQDERGT
jgi:hypothetical protein